MGTTAEKLTYLNDTKSLLKDSINSLGGDITSQTTFRQYATELDSIYASLPKVSGSGSNISLSPTRKGRITSQINGDTEQETTEGYQLLKLNNKEASSPVGLTEYSIFNEEITLKGTANSSGNLTLYFDNLTLPAGDYTLVAYLTNTVPSNSSQVWLRKRNENITGLNLWGGLKRVKNFTLDEETTILGGANNSYLYVNGNMSFDTKIKLMILSGTYTADNVPDWEKYTNGASPNPDYPQEKQSTTGRQEISINSKNLLEITENSRLTRCTYVSGANTNEYKLLCTASDMYVNEVRNVGSSYDKNICGNLISCKYGETVYFDNGNNLFSKNFFGEFDENLTALGFYDKYVSSGTYTPTNQNCKYITYRFGYGNNAQEGTTYTLAPIICKVSDTSYVPYQNQTKELNLDNIKLRKSKDGTYSDYITGTPDNWSIKRQIGSVVLDGTETWYKANENINVWVNNLANSHGTDRKYTNSRGDFVCNYFSYLGDAQLENLGNAMSFNVSNAYKDSVYIQIDPNIASSNSELKSWLSNHNTIVDYVLAEETTETITNQEIINQLNEIYNLQSYNGTTNITITSDNLELIMTASALKGDE